VKLVLVDCSARSPNVTLVVYEEFVPRAGGEMVFGLPSTAHPKQARTAADRRTARKKPYVNRRLAQLGRFRNPLIVRGARQVHVFRAGLPPNVANLSTRRRAPILERLGRPAQTK